MNYLWEAVLLAEENEGDRDRLTFIPASNPSPYIEVSMIDLNKRYPEEDRLEINLLYRFSDIFENIFTEHTDNMAQIREIFFDICMHYIVQLDLREGLSCEDYYCRTIASDFVTKKYGKKCGERFQLFRNAEKKIIVRSCLHLLRSRNYVEEFRGVITKLYPQLIMYENDETACEFLVYLGTAETEAERERVQFLRDLFLPIQGKVHCFYEHHFGIIDVEATMLLDEMVLF